MDIFSRKYSKDISVFNSVDFKSLANIYTGAVFTILNNENFSFKDNSGNIFSTVPNEYRVNEMVIYPHEGMIITFENDTTHTFTSKEEIEELATAYFEPFAITPPVLTTERCSLMFYEGIQYTSHYKTFKTMPHDNIDITYSYN